MSTSSSATMPPAAPNRFVTGHDQTTGAAVFAYESPVTTTTVLAADGSIAAVFGAPWSTHEFPSDNSGTTDAATDGSGDIANERGTICRVVNIPPGSLSPMHRTVSTDYDVIVSGEVYLILDSGEERLVRPGDIVVQRGTMHAWHNRSDEWVRMVAVLVAAEPVEVAGKVMGHDIPANTLAEPDLVGAK